MVSEALIPRVEGRKSTYVERRHLADHEADHIDGGDGQGRDIERTVLPQLASHRPVKRLSLRQGCGCDSLRGQRRRHGVRLSSHIAIDAVMDARFPAALV